MHTHRRIEIERIRVAIRNRCENC